MESSPRNVAALVIVAVIVVGLLVFCVSMCCQLWGIKQRILNLLRWCFNCVMNKPDEATNQTPSQRIIESLSPWIRRQVDLNQTPENPSAPSENEFTNSLRTPPPNYSTLKSPGPPTYSSTINRVIPKQQDAIANGSSSHWVIVVNEKEQTVKAGCPSAGRENLSYEDAEGNLDTKGSSGTATNENDSSYIKLSRSNEKNDIQENKTKSSPTSSYKQPKSSPTPPSKTKKSSPTPSSKTPKSSPFSKHRKSSPIPYSKNAKKRKQPIVCSEPLVISPLGNSNFYDKCESYKVIRTWSTPFSQCQPFQSEMEKVYAGNSICHFVNTKFIVDGMKRDSVTRSFIVSPVKLEDSDDDARLTSYQNIDCDTTYEHNNNNNNEQEVYGNQRKKYSETEVPTLLVTDPEENLIYQSDDLSVQENKFLNNVSTAT